MTSKPPEWPEWDRDMARRSLEGDPERNEAALLALYGLPPDASDDKRRRLAVTLVREALAALDPGGGWPRFPLNLQLKEQTPLEWLTDLCVRLKVADREAFGPFVPTSSDAEYVTTARNAYWAAAFIFLRAGAFVEPRRLNPTAKEVSVLVRILRKSDARRRSK